MLGWLKRVLNDDGVSVIDEIRSTHVAGAIAETADFAGLNFLSAIEAHVRWKIRLQEYIDGKSSEDLQEDVICRDDHCVLGRWIHGPGATAYGDQPLFAELREAHREFHRNAAFVIILAKDHCHAEAQRELHQGDYARSSIHIKRILARLFVELREASRPQLVRTGT